MIVFVNSRTPEKPMNEMTGKRNVNLCLMKSNCETLIASYLNSYDVYNVCDRTEFDDDDAGSVWT